MQTEQNFNKYESGINNNDNDVSEFRIYNIMAKKSLWNGDIISAYNLFEKTKSILGCGYCKFLMGEKEDAIKYLILIKDSSSAANWLIELINFLNNDENSAPTYMQIRNFYEQDLDMLFKYQRNDDINKILKDIKFFGFYNKEVYKYTARVLFNHDLYALAETYINKSLEIFYNDPETHYILGEIYLKFNKFEKAREEFKKADKVIQGYLPAKEKLLTLKDL
jgi:tetratricopeptide (TPR) repeat protein